MVFSMTIDAHKVSSLVDIYKANLYHAHKAILKN